MSTKKTHENSFSVRLRSAMTERNLAQRELAELLGTTQSTVSGWLNRGSAPRGKSLTKLADVLGVPVVWLAYGVQGSPVGKGTQGSAFSMRELLLTTPAKDSPATTHLLLPAAQQHMLSAAISIMQAVQTGELPLPELDQARALLDLVYPSRLKD